MGRIKRGWGLTKKSWALLNGHRELIRFPLYGAVATTLTLAHLPPLRRAGPALLRAVATYGAAIIVFGISRSFLLSFLALAVAGAADSVSVVIRMTLSQLGTPDALRGRVSAIHSLFIGTSNELGNFESGTLAALIGPVASVVAGGLGTLITVAVVAAKWPEVRRLGRLEGALTPLPLIADSGGSP